MTTTTETHGVFRDHPTALTPGQSARLFAEYQDGLKKRRLVRLHNGEDLLTIGKDTDAGVRTAAGVIAWADIAGFMTWNEALGRRVFVPVD